MPNVGKDYVLSPDQHNLPVRWFVPPEALRLPRFPDCSDAVLERGFGPGKSMRIKSWGHDANGVHWLATRGGTGLHVDKVFGRYTHHLVVRNDGSRVRGLHDVEQELWHPPMVRGAMYCIDTHSPHQGTDDPRWGVKPLYKVMIAVDRPEPLTPREAWTLLGPWLRREPGDTIADAPFAAPRAKAGA